MSALRSPHGFADARPSIPRVAEATLSVGTGPASLQSAGGAPRIPSSETPQRGEQRAACGDTSHGVARGRNRRKRYYANYGERDTINLRDFEENENKTTTEMRMI